RGIDELGAFDHGKLRRAAAGQLLGDLVGIGRPLRLDLVLGEAGLDQAVMARRVQRLGVFEEIVGGRDLALGPGLRLDNGEGRGAPERLAAIGAQKRAETVMENPSWNSWGPSL